MTKQTDNFNSNQTLYSEKVQDFDSNPSGNQSDNAEEMNGLEFKRSLKHEKPVQNKTETLSKNELFMQEAIREAEKAYERQEVPIGCVIVYDNQIIGRGYNLRQTLQQASHHAEMAAIEQACSAIGSWRLEDCSLYVTLEPCPMCAGAIIQSRIPEVFFGAYDPKGGSVCSCNTLFENPAYNHHPKWKGGILEEDCAGLLKRFFKDARQKQKLLKKQSTECSS